GAGQYLGRLVNEASELLGNQFRIVPNQFAVFFAVLVTLYFWWSNIKGLHESSGKALRIMQVTTVMVVIFLVWCGITLATRGPAQIPPPPTPSNLQFSEEGLGWFKGTVWPTIPMVAIISANGVMNRVAEDGVLDPWFQKPHRRFGTTFRIINVVTVLQILTIIASRGDTYTLGEAYAFGIVWSFFLKALSVLVLRFQRHDQEY